METGIRPPIQMAVDSMRNLCLGYTGEQNAQLIQIDVSKWQEKWPGASIDLMLALPGEKASYPAKTELQDGKLLFLPGYGDTQKPGHGAAYVVATKDGTHLAASDTVLTEIMHKGRGGDELPEAPEAQAGWVAEVLDAAHRAEEAAERAENAQVTDEQVGKAVEDYLQENPVEFVEKDPSVPAWAKQPEKPTYTADEVGAQPKGDYALKSEIPAPYTLPTASAEVKGGVKVGKGLRMDGDVLGVIQENNYELIEKIVIPEATQKITRTETPQGKQYSFENILIHIYYVEPGHDRTKWIRITLKTENGNILTAFTTNEGGTLTGDQIIKTIRENNYMAFRMSGITTNAGNVNRENAAKVSNSCILDNGSIIRIEIDREDGFNTGDEIKIMGVCSNA